MTRLGDEKIMTDTIGIDISKDHLDAHRLSDEKFAQFANNKAGLKTLNKWIGCTSHRVVYEATGRYTTARWKPACHKLVLLWLRSIQDAPDSLLMQLERTPKPTV